MYLAKRFSYFFLAFALCAAMSLWSLSFMPLSFAKSNPLPDGVSSCFEVDYLDTSGSSHSVLVCFTSGSLSTYSYTGGWCPPGSPYLYIQTYNGSLSERNLICPYPSGSSGFFIVDGVRGQSFSGGTLASLSLAVSSNFSSWSRISSYYPSGDSIYIGRVPLGSSPVLLQSSFNLDFSNPISSIPLYWDYSPFYFPEMPHGYFDGNINVVDGTYNIDFPSDASISGAITQTGNDHYTWTWNHGTLYWNGETVQGEHEGWISPDYQHQVYPNGDITQTAYAKRLINLSLSDLDSVVNYSPAYNENSRFRCWSCVMDSSYVWFVSDTRNKITGSIVSVSSDEVTWQYVFSDPQGGNTIYPTWAIVFSPMGEVIQVLSPLNVANKNTYSLSCSIGILKQNQDSGIWSCDPLYHGFWFSNDSPPVAYISHLNVSENKKYLAIPVFGDSAFQLNFLDSINRGISDINTNIQSLQSAMQSSISGQTSDFQNMDAPSAPQPSTSQMMDYFSKESAFSAPNTDEVFSGDIKSGHYWDGVTWWSTKFNDIIVSNQVIVAFTTAMLTLGLAVLIIGRRFSMR